MNSPVKLEFLGFALAVIVAGVLIWGTEHAAWEQLKELRSAFGALETKNFHLADRLEAAILDLNETLLRYDLRRNSADRLSFRQKSQTLQGWMARQQTGVTTPREGELLGQITAALDMYLVRTGTLIDESTTTPRSARTLSTLESVQDSSAPFLELCRKLDEAQQQALSQIGSDSHRSAIWLQRLLLVSLFLLFVFWVAFTVLVYRSLIAPLRMKLIASRAIIERQEKLAALGTLAAGVAHEIRNPLTAIKVRLHSLKKTLSPGSIEQEDAVLIGDEISRLEQIVKDFLQFARPAAPQFVTTTSDSLLRKVHDLLRPQLMKSSIALKLAPSLPSWIRVDPQQIQQVLINLVQNAAESIGQNGTITLRSTNRLAPLAGRATPVVLLEIIDTGKGIPPEVQKRLFDPFFTTKAGGTGLGLSIVARIVEQHGGALHYQTQANRGTTFRLFLPKAPQDET